jgi:sporulation protein YlmC with PRC-barrel domain
MKTQSNWIARWPRAGGALAFVLTLAAGVASAAPAATLQATQFFGTPVSDSAGRNIGQVADLVLEPGLERLVSVVVALSDPAAAGRLVALPARGAAMRDGKLVLDADADKLRELPTFNAGELDPARAVAGEPPRARRVGEMLAADLRQGDGRDIGDVDDVLFRLEDGKVIGVAAKLDPSWLQMEGLIALPLTSLRAQGKDFVALFESKDVRPSGAAPAQAAPTQAATARPAATPLDPEARISRLVGAVVVDAEGRTLGKVEDALVDTRTRRMTHAVIALDQPGGAPRRVGLAFPAAGLDWQPGKLTVRDDPAKLPAANGAASEPGVLQSSRLLKAHIADDSGKDVGNLEDVIVNLRTGQVQFAVAKFTPDWIQAGMLVAVPLRPLREERKGLSMKFGLNELNGAYIFDGRHWPDVADPDVRKIIDAYVSRL